MPVSRNLSDTGWALTAVWAVSLLALFDCSVATNSTTPSPASTPAPTNVTTSLTNSIGFRAVYGSGGHKSWDQAQKQCQDWGGNLVKADASDDTVKKRLEKIKCSDVLWVGAHEDPKAPGVNKDSWKWISDGSSVSMSTKMWLPNKPNNNNGKTEMDCGLVGTQIPSLRLGDAPCDVNSKIYFACEVPGLENDEVGEIIDGEYSKVSDCKALKEHKACLLDKLNTEKCLTSVKCYETCKEYDMCGCHPTNGNCYKGNVDPKCKDVENGKTYPGQAADTWCWDGRSDSESTAGHKHCSSSSALSTTATQPTGTITLLLVAAVATLSGH